MREDTVTVYMLAASGVFLFWRKIVRRSVWRTQ